MSLMQSGHYVLIHLKDRYTGELLGVGGQQRSPFMQSHKHADDTPYVGFIDIHQALDVYRSQRFYLGSSRCTQWSID